jgi:hypothetical protein
MKVEKSAPNASSFAFSAANPALSFRDASYLSHSDTMAHEPIRISVIKELKTKSSKL